MVDKVACPSCSNDISSEEEFCPHCGNWMGGSKPELESEAHEVVDSSLPKSVEVAPADEESVEPLPPQTNILAEIREPAPPLSEEAPSPVICANCSKELQIDWVACPFCGHSRNGKVDATSVLPQQEPPPITPSLPQTEPVRPAPISKSTVLKPSPTPKKEPARVASSLAQTKPTPIRKSTTSKPSSTSIQSNANNWSELLNHILGVAILGGVIGCIVGILIGAVGSWTRVWPVVGAVLGGVIGLVWFGFGVLLVATSLPGIISGKDDFTLTPLSMVSSLPVAGFGTWLTIVISAHGNPWDGALWLGLGSMSMGALVGACIGLSPKHK